MKSKLLVLDNNSIKSVNYTYITKELDAKEALNDIANYPIMEVDTEGTGLDPFTSKVSLLQIGTKDKAYVFDVRKDTPHSDIGLDLFKPILADKYYKKVLQNAVYDMKMVKVHGGFYIENIYDTMLAEQLFNLGLIFKSASLSAIVERYLGIILDKEPRNTFEDYGQTFKKYQLDYAAKDVCLLQEIRNIQIERLASEGLEDAARIEFEFTKAMCEMELNGVSLDVDKWRIIMAELDAERLDCLHNVESAFMKVQDQNTIFGNSLINIKSNQQLKKALGKYGINVPDVKAGTLLKYEKVPVVGELLKHSKLEKMVSTYGESLIERIHPLTGRLHTSFKQMVATGRMSSSNPNL